LGWSTDRSRLSSEYHSTEVDGPPLADQHRMTRRSLLVLAADVAIGPVVSRAAIVDEIEPSVSEVR
jgi:hypothetical protein